MRCTARWRVLENRTVMNGCDKACLCGEVAKIEQNRFPESDYENPCIALEAWISNQQKECFSNYVPQNPIIPQKPFGTCSFCGKKDKQVQFQDSICNLTNFCIILLKMHTHMQTYNYIFVQNCYWKGKNYAEKYKNLIIEYHGYILVISMQKFTLARM